MPLTNASLLEYFGTFTLFYVGFACTLASAIAGNLIYLNYMKNYSL